MWINTLFFNLSWSVVSYFNYTNQKARRGRRGREQAGRRRHAEWRGGGSSQAYVHITQRCFCDSLTAIIIDGVSHTTRAELSEASMNEKISDRMYDVCRMCERVMKKQIYTTNVQIDMCLCATCERCEVLIQIINEPCERNNVIIVGRWIHYNNNNIHLCSWCYSN